MEAGAGRLEAGAGLDGNLRELLGQMERAVKRAVPERKVAVAFSGGVDSFLMGRICSDLGYDTTLVTTGFAGSHDVTFSREAGRLLGLPHHTISIDPASFGYVSAEIRRSIGTGDISWNENCIAFHYVSRAAQGLGASAVVTANGIDELFCGYDAYRRAYHSGPLYMQRMIRAKVESELRMMEAVSSVALRNGVRIAHPLLSPEFVAYAADIPLEEKITGADDLVRKHVIRRLALAAGVPAVSAAKRKKALQYGTGIHKAWIRLQLR